MNEIKRLPAEVSTKVAAGEVVEKPYNIVKELVENSLDSGAQNISVYIEDGGLAMVKVSDDGKGITPQDLPLTIERFATSKISDVDDIYSLSTFGFRGEALAAISSVSRFSIKTHREGEAAQELVCNYGEELEIKPTAPIKGTVVTVKDIFQNVPARLKFFNSPKASEREISRFIKHMSLLHPDIAFSLNINGKETYSSSIGIDAVFKDVFGVSEFVTGENSYGAMGITFASTLPTIQRMRKDAIVIGVNGRLVKDNSLVQAVVQAYHRMMPDNRYPAAVISLYLKPEDVDANVHPTKINVNLLNKRDAFSFVYDSVKRRLEQRDDKPLASFKADSDQSHSEPVFRDNASLYKPSYDMAREFESSKTYDRKEVYRQSEQYRQKSFEAENTLEYSSEVDSNAPVVKGQLFDAVIVAEFPGGDSVFIDQHVAHERILYERFKEQKDMGIATVVLFEPVVITLEDDFASVLEDELETFEQFGYSVEIFGKNAFKIVKVPVDAVNRDVEKQVIEILTEMAELKGSKVADYKIVSMSCKAAVKAGERLTIPEMQNIVDELYECKNPYTCPHGRPILFNLDQDFFFRKFGR